MEKRLFEEKKYYIIKKNVFWAGVVMVLIIIALLITKICDNAKSLCIGEECMDSYCIEFGSLDSKIEDIEGCYLCGNVDRSLMSYYKKFDTIGIIGLNEWYVLDLRLKAYDENGNEITESGADGAVSGQTQGVCYEIDYMGSRHKSSATVSSEKEFDATFVQNNLCQECLDKVTDTLEKYCKKGEKETFSPFVLVDFETLDIYSLQGKYTGMSVRDYWVEVEMAEGVTIVDAYYLPDRSK